MASSCASLVKPHGCGTPSDPIWSVIRVMFETLLSLHSQQDHGSWFLSFLLLLRMTSQALPWTTLLGVTSFIIRLCFLRLFNSDCLLLPSTSCVILLGTVVSDVLVWPGFSAKTSLTHTGTQNFFLERPCKLVLEVLLLDLGMSVVGFGVRPQAACTEVWGMLGLDLYRVRRYSAMQCLLI